MTIEVNTAPAAAQAQGVPTREALDETHGGLGNPAPVIDNGPSPKLEAKPDGQTPVAKDPALEAVTTGADQVQDGQPQDPVGEWASFEEPAAQAAVDLLKASGVTIKQAGAIFDKALETGDLADVDTKLLTELIGAAQATLVLEGVKAYHANETSRVQSEVKVIKDVFGGERGWETVRDWARIKETRDPEFKRELDGIRADIDRGGRAARAAAQDLLSLYNANPKTQGLGNDQLVRGERVAKAELTPLSRAEYVEAYKKAHAEGASEAALRQLDARRLAGKSAGR